MAHVGTRPPQTTQFALPTRWVARWRAQGGRVLRALDPSLEPYLKGRPERLSVLEARLEAAADTGPEVELLRRIDAGEPMASIARELGVATSTISRRVAKLREGGTR